MLRTIASLARVALELARRQERRTGSVNDMRLLMAARAFLEACIFRMEQDE